MDGKEAQSLKICVVTGIPPLNLLVFRFVQVLEPIVDELVLITGNYPEKDVFSSKIKLINIIKAQSRKQSLLVEIPKFALRQLRMAYHLAKNMSQARIVIFFLEGGTLLLPMLVARLAHKKTIIVVTYSASQIARQVNQGSKAQLLLPVVMSLIERLNYQLAQKLVVYSPNIVSCLGLEKYRNKILLTHEYFLDFDKFNVQKQLNDRDNLVGYIGRISEEKGVMNFVKAIPEILKERNEVKFLVGGHGRLIDEIEKYLSQQNLNDKVKLMGWIPHDELSNYLNELKLLVIPSYTETGPYIAFEAGACGTPILGTPVGLMSDVIKDGQTGFIMKDNSPECIARNIIRALEHPNLEEIAQNARGLMESDFTYEKAVERYRKILENI
ncbi:MAG: Alpha-D-kanosaminyltransferase [candidate division WS2 bacterium]|uniref:Alpha-D-kanosaminyltransferase n=1 Tax=Psychracetigena formicireducens TaxID=2986056 RepID=A0A9E2BMU3_PSYF1|nr:Alpha-D-kanosaminyltransferase [Candidatus Psychracetigena formicireducens]